MLRGDRTDVFAPSQNHVDQDTSAKTPGEAMLISAPVLILAPETKRRPQLVLLWSDNMSTQPTAHCMVEGSSPHRAGALVAIHRCRRTY